MGNALSRPLLVLLGLAGLVMVALLDQFYFETGINYEGAPDFSPSHLVRSLVIALSVFLLFTGLRGRHPPALDLSGGRGIWLVTLSTIGVMLLAPLSPMLLMVSPEAFNTMAREDAPVEWVSAILYFCCALLFVLAFIHCRRCFAPRERGRWLFVVPAAVLFFLGMEEISWFQRVLGIETFGIFEANRQKEINLHNFYTEPLETAFYFAAFLFLVVLPFLRACHPGIAGKRYLAILMPLPYVVVTGAMACAYNYDMWNIVFLQAAFYGSIVVLWIMADLCRSRFDRMVLLAAIIMMLLVQALFLLFGDTLIRIWRVTEYRELLIPLGLLFYSLGVYGQVARINLVSLPAGIQGKTT